MKNSRQLSLSAMITQISQFSPYCSTGQSVLNVNTVPKTTVHFRTTDPVLQIVYDDAVKKADWNFAQFGTCKVLMEGAGYNNSVWLETLPMGGCMYGKRDLEIARNSMLSLISRPTRKYYTVNYRNRQIFNPVY